MFVQKALNCLFLLNVENFHPACQIYEELFPLSHNYISETKINITGKCGEHNSLAHDWKILANVPNNMQKEIENRGLIHTFT